MKTWKILFIALWILAVPAQAAEESAALTPRQRWEKLSDADKDHLRENYNRFKSMDREERQQLVEQFGRFKRLPPTERQTILERHQKFQKLTSDQQNHIRQRFQQFQKLPRSERMQRLQKMRERRSDSVNGAGNRAPGSAAPVLPRVQKPFRRNK